MRLNNSSIFFFFRNVFLHRFWSLLAVLSELCFCRQHTEQLFTAALERYQVYVCIICTGTSQSYTCICLLFQSNAGLVFSHLSCPSPRHVPEGKMKLHHTSNSQQHIPRMIIPPRYVRIEYCCKAENCCAVLLCSAVLFCKESFTVCGVLRYVTIAQRMIFRGLATITTKNLSAQGKRRKNTTKRKKLPRVRTRDKPQIRAQ